MDETRQLARNLGFIPVELPLSTRIEPWECDRKCRTTGNGVEPLFGRLKGYRPIFTRFEKLYVLFLAFISSFLLVADGLRLCLHAPVALAKGRR